MKTTKLILLCIILLLGFIPFAMAQEAKKYAVKSGYLKLELSGDTVGTKELWWDDYGQKTAEREQSVTTTKMFGMTNTEKKDMLTIIDGDKYWTIDYLDNSGAKGTLTYYDDTWDFADSMSEREREEFAAEMLAALGGEKLGTETVGGYKCDVFSVMGVKSWVYKGVTIKTRGQVLGMESDEMFTLFKPDSKVPASKFIPPGNIRYEDLSAVMNRFYGDFDDYEDEEDEEIVPVNYPYEKFCSVVDGFLEPGYMSMGKNNVDGVYAAAFIKGFSGSLMIVVQSRKNNGTEEYEGYEKFTRKGHTCYYGDMEDEDGTALIVEYPKYDMHLAIAAMPGEGKAELLAIWDKLKF